MTEVVWQGSTLQASFVFYNDHQLVAQATEAGSAQPLRARQDYRLSVSITASREKFPAPSPGTCRQATKHDARCTSR